MRVPTTTLQNSFGKYLKKVMAGDEVIITKNGRGVAKMVKYEDPMIRVLKDGTSEYYIRKRVTYEEYLEITEHSDARYELIDGELYLMASPKHSHQVAVAEIFGKMYNWFSDKSCQPLTAPFDVKLHNDSPSFEDDPNVVQPDILVVCDEENIDEDDIYQGIPALVVEVLSKSTRSKDMIKKLNLYTKSGVQEYWIVDTEAKAILVYSLEERDIKAVRTFNYGETVASVCFEGLEVDTKHVFPK